MSDARYTITLDFKGKEELNSIVEKLLRKYDIDAEADFSKVAVGIEKNISSPMTTRDKRYTTNIMEILFSCFSFGFLPAPGRCFSTHLIIGKRR